MNYPVNLQSLHENFPPDFEVPALLLEFGKWLMKKPWGSVGCFSLQSERFDDYWIENGSDLHPYFAFFICDPTGGQVGYWLPNGPATNAPPIVLVGSEGELSVLSDSLEEFLSQLANGKTHASDLDSRDQGADEGPDLLNWLEGHTIHQAPNQSNPDHPDLEQWIERWGQKQREWIDTDSAHLQIADRLRKYVKPNAKSWETANFDVLLVGGQFRMWHRSYGLKPMPHDEVADLEPLFRSVRIQRARSVPERGLWFSAWVKVGPRRGAKLSCNFIDQPKFLDEKPVVSTSDYEQDLNAFRRSNHWMPKWLE